MPVDRTRMSSPQKNDKAEVECATSGASTESTEWTQRGESWISLIFGFFESDRQKAKVLPFVAQAL